MLASGSVAGAMDDDFNSEAFLEIRRVAVHDTTTKEMPLVGRTLMADRVFCIDWSPFGGANGILAGCFTDGSVQVWSVDTILKNFAEGTEEDPVLCRIAAHQGACRTLQFNPTQPHYLATGGQDKELCIWSLQEPREPAAVPALTKATHPAEITDVKWNPKFAHILATATSNGAVIVWDLKARRTALTFNVSSTQPGAANAIAWHPDVSTHIAVARDDVNPVVQLWDLKKAVAPIRELRGHNKGVTSLSWNAEDPSLLLSCGCDGRTLCWNPNTGDLLGELPPQDTWVYQVQWAPTITAVLATSSFDSHFGVFSAQDVISGGTGSTRTVPKWLRRPCGAVFGFGGRVAAPVKGTNNIAISVTTRGDATGDQQFRQSLIANPSRTPQRVELLKALQLPLLAATEEAAISRTRQPLLAFLDVNADELEASVENMPQPFSKEEDELETLLSKCIAAGRIAAGVKLCIAAGRLDDAFAVAQLASQPSGPVVDVLKAYSATGRLRFVAYVKAILLDAHDELLQNASLPWREVLSLLATYVAPQQFAALADAFGNALKARKEVDGAAAAFVCSGDVNAVADLFAEAGSMTAQKLVQYITLLEQTVGKLCTAPSFAQVLSAYAGVLANAGDFEGALLLSNRAAQLGDVAAAVVADRIQYHVPSAAAVKVGFPFALAVVPDATSIECQMMASQQRPVAVAQKPSAAAAHAQPVAPQASVHQQVAAPQAHHHQNHVDPRHLHAPATHAAPAPTTLHHAPPATHPHHFHQPAAYSPTTQHPPSHHQPQAHSTAAPQTQTAHPPALQASAAPQAYAPQPPHATPQIIQPNFAPSGQSVLTPATAPPPVHSAPPTQHTAQPTAATPFAPTVAARPATATPAALPPAALTAFDINALANPAHQAIARGIIDATSKVTDKRKRDAIEKSATDLFDRLAKNLLEDAVVEQLGAFVQSLGTAAAKENWRRLSDAHFDKVQPFLNIKFL